MTNPLITIFQPAPNGILRSPGRRDLPYVPPIDSTAFLSKARLFSVFTVDPPDSFELGVTLPVLVDPLNPVGTDNVGWSGDTSGGTFLTTHTVPANTTRKGCVFLCDVILTDATSILDDCLILGGTATPSRLGLVMANNGGQLIRCTIWGTHTSVQYYRNGIRHSAGDLHVERCGIFRCIDGVRSSGGRTYVHGNLFDRFAFFADDSDHASGSASAPPYWTHNDALQVTAGAGPHEFIGNLVYGRCDLTGVTWSGGSPGSGNAIDGTNSGAVTSRPTVATPIGTPSYQLNGTPSPLDPSPPGGGYSRYFNAFGYGLYCNGITFSNSSGFIGIITDNWIEFTNDPSANVQFTTGTTNQITLLRNRLGVGGFRTLSTRKFLGSWSSSTPAGQVNTGSGADRNVFGDFPSCVATATLNGVSKPGGIVGEPVIVTTGGVRFTA